MNSLCIINITKKLRIPISPVKHTSSKHSWHIKQYFGYKKNNSER